jgi:predicted RNA polymerase sigma factor
VGVTSAVAEAFAAEWGQGVATPIRLTGDRDLAEDCAADAFAVALEFSLVPSTSRPSRTKCPTTGCG